jgi:hypothetical protein
MHRLSWLLVAALIAGGSLPELVEAQVRPWVISIAGGPSFPVGELTDEASTGWHVQGSVGFGLPLLPVAFRGDLLWQEFPDVHGDEVRQIGGLANAVLSMPMALIRPYVLLGAGLIRTEEHGDSGSDVGFNAGGGIDFPFMGLGGFIEVRYLNIFGGGEATDFQSVPVSVGIRF